MYSGLGTDDAASSKRRKLGDISNKPESLAKGVTLSADVGLPQKVIESLSRSSSSLLSNVQFKQPKWSKTYTGYASAKPKYEDDYSQPSGCPSSSSWSSSFVSNDSKLPAQPSGNEEDESADDDASAISEDERLRLKNIERNEQQLASLGLLPAEEKRTSRTLLMIIIPPHIWSKAYKCVFGTPNDVSRWIRQPKWGRKLIMVAQYPMTNNEVTSISSALTSSSSI